MTAKERGEDIVALFQKDFEAFRTSRVNTIFSYPKTSPQCSRPTDVNVDKPINQLHVKNKKYGRKESRRVKTLSSFIKWAAQFNDGQYLFRGVSKDSYKIEASACRRLPEEERSNPDRLLRINQELIEKARLLGHDQQSGQRLSDLELLAELQHLVPPPA